MAPIKPSAKAGKGSSKSSKSFKSPLPSKVSKKSKAVPSKKDEIKTKRPSSSMLSAPTRRTKKQYSAEELGVSTLNGIVPSGIQKVKGTKKGKVFVDDQEQMMMILKMVEAEKTKDVESKLMRARQLEEIREARRKEMEKRQSKKKERLEETKDALRKKRKRKAKSEGGLDVAAVQAEAEKITTNGVPSKSKKKGVSFG